MENKRGIKPKEEEITDPLFKKLKDDLQKASYFAKLGNKDKTTQYATMAFNKALQKKDFLKAIKISEDFYLSRENLNTALEGVIEALLKSKKHKEALKICEQYKLTPKNLPDIALTVFKEHIESGNLEQAKLIKNKFGLKKPKILPIVLENYNKFMARGMLMRGEILIKEYEISSQDATEGFIKIFLWFIKNKQYNEAIQVKQKHSFPKSTKIQIAIIEAYRDLMMKEHFNIAKSWLKEFEIPPEENEKIVIWLIDQKFKSNSTNTAILIKNEFNPPKAPLMGIAYKHFETFIVKGNFELAATIRKNFELPEEKITPIVSQIYKLKMQGGSYDKAVELTKEYKIPNEIIIPEALKAFEFSINRRNYKRASLLKNEFQIPEKTVESFALKAFESKINQNNFETAKMIMNHFNIPQPKVNFLISNIIESLTKKKLFERAAFLGNFFHLPKSDIEEIEWKIFDRKMVNGKYADAYVLTKEYNLSPEKVKKKVEEYIKILEEKGSKTSADFIRNEFKTEKKGFFKKLFG